MLTGIIISIFNPPAPQAHLLKNENMKLPKCPQCHKSVWKLHFKHIVKSICDKDKIYHGLCWKRLVDIKKKKVYN